MNPTARTYLYGIAEGASETDLGIPGVDGTNPAYILPGDGLGWVASSYGGEDWGNLPREELVKCLLRHQQVVERVMRERTVLPVKFGTTLDSPEELRALLAQADRDLAKVLDSMQDKVEIEVAATWDVARVLEEVGHEDEVVQAREAIIRKGEPTAEDRMKLGQMVKACLDRRRDAYRERMLDVLRPLVAGVAPNALISDEMVMNVAFLVERARESEFDERVRELDSLFDNQITFRVIGPLPPYSFSTVEITRLTLEQVEEARQELELPERFAEADIRRAYRRLAAAEQRKALSGTEAPPDRLAKLRRASEVLQACWRGRASAGDRGDVCRSGATDCLFAVSVRGTGYQDVEAARFGGAVRV